VWLVFNVMIALLLVEMGVFDAIAKVLALYANIAIAWIGALFADLVINKPLGCSPRTSSSSARISTTSTRGRRRDADGGRRRDARA
jgi:hypothetical protein